jgi:hypothetical protein
LLATLKSHFKLCFLEKTPQKSQDIILAAKKKGQDSWAKKKSGIKKVVSKNKKVTMPFFIVITVFILFE